MLPKVIKQILLWLPPAVWAGVIFKLSAGTVPVASEFYWNDFVIKKSAHMLFYGILALLVYRGLRGEGIKKKKAMIWAVIVAAFYGATDEYHQMFTQGREARVRDIFFDGIGAIGAMLITYYWLPKLPKKVKELCLP